MLIATELGGDPLLRRHVREQYKNFALVSTLPTEKGKVKINEEHPYHVGHIISLFVPDI